MTEQHLSPNFRPDQQSGSHDVTKSDIKATPEVIPTNDGVNDVVNQHGPDHVWENNVYGIDPYVASDTSEQINSGAGPAQ